MSFVTIRLESRHEVCRSNSQYERAKSPVASVAASIHEYAGAECLCNARPCRTRQSFLSIRRSNVPDGCREAGPRNRHPASESVEANGTESDHARSRPVVLGRLFCPTDPFRKMWCPD